jgi:hypothetical protein
MKITLHEIAIADIVKGYVNNNEEGVVGYDGKLNIRPPYQREFVYKDPQKVAVIHTILKGFPLNVMYWAKNEDGTYEVLDGQQRTLSFCEFLTTNNFHIKNEDGRIMYSHSLPQSEKDKIYNYKVMVYICEGSDKERLKWFETINIAGEKLTPQELLNVNYTGSWLADAKRRFSKTNCVAYNMSKYGDKKFLLNGSPIRQEYLETALSWISGGKENISEYMSAHQHDENADELFNYFRDVIDWVKKTFPTYRKEMKGLEWGRLYAEYGENEYDVAELEEKINSLMADEDVTDHKGVYEYVLSNCSKDKERHLSIRKFSDKDKRTAYEKQNGICPICGEYHTIEEMEGDHIVAWSKGGKTTIDNLQMLCKKCNREKSNI